MGIDEIIESLEKAAQTSRERTGNLVREAFQKHFGRGIETVPDLSEITRYVNRDDGSAFYQYQGETFLYTWEEIETVRNEKTIDVILRTKYRTE